MGSIDIKESKCWTCKHSLCVSETHFMSRHSHPEPKENLPFEGFDNESEDEEEGEEVIEHILPLSNIKGLCFYNPEHPLLVGLVEECNRHEAKA